MGLSLMNMLGLSSSVRIAHIACYWEFFLLRYIQVLCQYSLYWISDFKATDFPQMLIWTWEGWDDPRSRANCHIYRTNLVSYWEIIYHQTKWGSTGKDVAIASRAGWLQPIIHTLQFHQILWTSSRSIKTTGSRKSGVWNYDFFFSVLHKTILVYE
jgi:hypothetical protein